MDLFDLSEMTLRRGWLALALAGLGFLAGLLFAQSRPPGYQATTRVAVQPARPADLGQTQATKAVLQSMMEDIRTYDMADAVAARLGADWLAARGMGPESMRLLLDKGDLGAGADENVYEIRITARSGLPADAVQISEKWAETFVDRRDKANLELDRDERIEALIRDEPVPQQYAPRRKLLAALGALAGLALGVLLVLGLEYRSRALIRHPREAERAAGAPFLGGVPGAVGAGGAANAAPGPGAAAGMRRSFSRLAGLWPILLFAGLGLAAALLFSQAQAPSYRARTRIAIEPASGGNWGNTQAIRETMRGYTQDILTRRMAREVNARLALDLPVDALLDKLNAAEEVGVYELYVDAFDPDPAVAMAISRSWAEFFIEEHRIADDRLDQRDRILVRLRDQPRSVLWAPRTRFNAAAGLLLGALVGLAVVLGLGRLRRAFVHSAGEAAAAAAAPLLAAIPAERRTPRAARGGASP